MYTNSLLQDVMQDVRYFVSLELEEVMNVSDRILVIYEGEIVGQLNPKTTTVQELGLYMSGAKRDKVKEINNAG